MDIRTLMVSIARPLCTILKQDTCFCGFARNIDCYCSSCAPLHLLKSSRVNFVMYPRGSYTISSRSVWPTKPYDTFLLWKLNVRIICVRPRLCRAIRRNLQLMVGGCQELLRRSPWEPSGTSAFCWGAL